MDKKMISNKRAQEEMVGFGFIIIIVAIILLVFVSISITRPRGDSVESYEIESFIQSMLQYTSDCEDYLGHLSIQKLIYSCQKEAMCLDGQDACGVLEDTLSGMINSSWQIENRPVEAYDLKILSEGQELVSFSKGNQTSNFKGATQKLPKEIDVLFNVYY